MARLRHFLIRGTAQSQSYISTARGSGEFRTPPRDARAAHGTTLADEVRQAAEAIQAEPERPAEGAVFVPIVVRSEPGFKLFLDSLDNRTIGSEIINVRYEEDGSQRATIHIPADKIAKFAKKFEDYAHKDHPRSGNPCNQNLAESITEIRLAMLRDGAYWTDSGPLPDASEEFWCEVWLRDESDVLTAGRQAVPVAQAFREDAQALGIRVSNQEARFPERVVVLAYSSMNQFSTFPGLLRYLAEFRRRGNWCHFILFRHRQPFEGKLVSLHFVSPPPTFRGRLRGSRLEVDAKTAGPCLGPIG